MKQSGSSEAETFSPGGMNNQMKLSSCHCCGLVHRLPAFGPGMKPVCTRCGTVLAHSMKKRNGWTLAFALSAVIVYVPAMTLPMMKLERLGHRHEDSLISGLISLFTEGYWGIGTIVVLFSVVLPFVKLVLLLFLASPLSPGKKHRAAIYRLVEAIGRWGMMDVMLLAILVAFVKLGDLARITAGSGLIAFAALVLLSMLAGLTFNPYLMWEDKQ